MKTIFLLFCLLLLAQFAFADENSSDNPAVFKRPPVKGLSRGPAPTITINDREISVMLPEAQNWQLTLFSTKGKRLKRKRVAGEQIAFRLPRSARNEIIVQIEAGAMRFFSQSITIK